jgi:hypothetical protein
MTEPNPEAPKPERIVVSYTLTSGEYEQYAAAVARRGYSPSSFYIFVAVAFLAIPVALLFRSVAAQQLNDDEAIEVAGRVSLYAYVMGVAAMMIWGYIARWIQRKRYYDATIRRDFTTVVIDGSAISVTVPGIEAKSQWSAVEGCTFKRGLLLVWIGPTQAAAIPSRSFESKESCDKAVAFIRARLAEAKRLGASAKT